MRQVVWGSSGKRNLKEVECGYQTAVIMLVWIQGTHSIVSDDSGLQGYYAVLFGVIGCRCFERVPSKRRKRQKLEIKVPQDTNSHYASYTLKCFT
jgi:hypothetical protein